MTDTQANIATLERGFARDLALAGVAAGLGGFAFWGAQHATVGDVWLWRGGAAVALGTAVLAAVQASAKQKEVRGDTMHAQPHADESDPLGAMAAALKKAAAAARSEARAEKAPKVSPIERERERLRAGGFSEAEISQILIAREMQGGYAGGGFGQGVLTGVLNNLTAVMGHVRNFLPSLKADLTKMLNYRLPFTARLEAAFVIVLKAAMVAVLAYVVSLEFLQLKAVVEKTRAEACSARMKMIAETLEPSKWAGANVEYDKDCAPHP